MTDRLIDNTLSSNCCLQGALPMHLLTYLLTFYMSVSAITFLPSFVVTRLAFSESVSHYFGKSEIHAFTEKFIKAA